MDNTNEAAQSAAVSETRTERLQRWEREVHAYEQSGLTVAAYCREHGLKEWQIHSWRRRVRDGATPVEGGFEQVSPSGPHRPREAKAVGGAELRIETNGCLIHVPECVSAVRLSAILSVVRSA